MAKRAKSHKDVEFQIDTPSGESRYFKHFNEAAAFAVTHAASGRPVELDVLIHSRAGAKWWGGDYAVKQYNDDPDASVSERLVISVDARGRIA